MHSPYYRKPDVILLELKRFPILCNNLILSTKSYFNTDMVLAYSFAGK